MHRSVSRPLALLVTSVLLAIGAGSTAHARAPDASGIIAILIG